MESNLVNHEALGPGGNINEQKWDESYAIVKGRDSSHSTLTNILKSHPDFSAMDIQDEGKKKGERKPNRKAHGRECECTCCWQCSYCFKKLLKFSKSHLTSKDCQAAQLAMIPNAMVRARTAHTPYIVTMHTHTHTHTHTQVNAHARNLCVYVSLPHTVRSHLADP
jgi:hypothetical protein